MEKKNLLVVWGGRGAATAGRLGGGTWRLHGLGHREIEELERGEERYITKGRKKRNTLARCSFLVGVLGTKGERA